MFAGSLIMAMQYISNTRNPAYKKLGHLLASGADGWHI
jgi:hypothetical protein